MTDEHGLNETVKLQAAHWLARQRSNLRTEADARNFQAWLAEDQAHGEAFEALTAVWDVAGSYSRDMRAGAAPSPASSSRRAVMAGLVAAPVAVGAGYMALLRPAEASTYATKVGEQQAIDLPDNSRALLDTNSRIDVLFNRDSRIVTLRYGRANFTVVSDRSRPFVVKAAEGRIIADTSNFDVRCDGQNSFVMVFSGQASVNLNNEVLRLAPGERVALMGRTIAAIDRPRPAAAGAWHSGRTVFENIRLSEAVAEMNRYSAVGLEIQGRDLLEKHISGVYRNGDSVAFANTVAVLTGAKIQETRGRVLLIASDGQPLTKK
ncbi:MAG: FecR domain-containing protein [Alphaproteobacteria bacterium]|nr:FecR domain-containing protein [Alphaproteobacteria bacterium]